MAPPKPTTPDAATKPKKKVTAAQVAFLVDRYLADNGFHAALAAFRSDAAHLFSPHRAKPPPKGLLPLADILHDYIALKEGRVAIDSAMHAMHSLVSNYYASSSSPPPPPITPAMMPPLPPAANTSQPSSPPLVPPLLVASSSSPPQPQGAAGYASPVVHHYAHTSTALLVHNSSDMPTKKRKHSKSAGKTTTASKKSCTTTSDAKAAGNNKAVASQLANHNLSAAHPTSAQHSAMANLPVQTSSVAKSLFRPLQPQLHSSPCSTPQPSHAIQDQDQPAACTTQRPLPVAATAHTQQDIASSQCSIVSSKTLIVSPLKGGTYYAVERSYHVSSPLKSTTHKSTKREHVKGKLNFDATDSRPGPSEQLICDKASTSSDEDKQDDFDIDFTNLDIFDGDFSFSELLLDLDLDLDTEGVHCQNPSTGAEVQRLEPVAKSGYVIADPGLPDAVKAVAADSTEDFDLQGATSVTSVRAITKRVKIVSPVKGRTAS
ncbi:IQ motif and SEC7 domain-containing protein 2-like isoform X2 [Panicum virgatum]|uniref:IQ motif and SEC7 domain-containing protein 2-like isoform X2 n=1 Tax=Panicum virgatum TaxID=38727 RepID=UPI0019D4EFB7|nr:IQ motif and SEC7 domain-containing protein 2-like isoform X2 [Panicum virgatum]